MSDVQTFGSKGSSGVYGLMDEIRSRTGMTGYGTYDSWPPPELKARWERMREHRRRYKNDHAEMLAHAPLFSQTQARSEVFTPVPVARDMSRLSSQLLFSEEPRFAGEKNEEERTELIRKNMLVSHLLEAGEKVSHEGYGCLRVFRDDATIDTPIIEYVSGDQFVPDLRHGRFLVGGTAVIERAIGGVSNTVYRLLETHEAGRVRRQLYLGTTLTLGREVPMNALREFEGLAEEEETLDGHSTLILWQNVPGGHSDLDALDALLDAVNESASYGREKVRKSVPITFADPSLADGTGRVDLSGVLFNRRGVPVNVATPLGDEAKNLTETVQPGLEADAHIAMAEHFVNLTLEMAGYSRATWGRDQGGSADSGKALKLRQVRTLMTRAGKDRMAVAAIARAIAIALAWEHGGDPDELEPEIKLGDGLPDDPLETAEELARLAGAEAISTEEKVRKLHPNMQKKDIMEEVRRIEKENAGPQPRVPELDVNFDSSEEEEVEEIKEPEEETEQPVRKRRRRR